MTLVLLAGLCAHAAQAQQSQGISSQTQPAPPAPTAQRSSQLAPAYRGLFGAGSSATPGGHLLDLTASIYGEYGNTPNSEIPTESALLSAGWFLGVRSGLSFEKAGRNTRFGLRGEGAFRYYRDSGQATFPRFRVDLGVNRETGSDKQNTLRVGGSVGYEPYYILSIFPSTVPVTGGTAIVPTNRDDLLFRRARTIYAQSFEFQHQLSPRTYLSLSEDARYTQADTPALDIRSIRAGVRYGYRMTRNASLRLGYAYQTGHYGLGAAQQLTSHDVDMSFDYQKPLSRSRRTSVGFSAGSSRLTEQATHQWTIVAAANLRHELGAGWFVRGDFLRNSQLVEGFSDPFFVNTTTASLGGFLGRRVEVLAAGAYSAGIVGFATDTYHALQGSTRLRLAIGRHLAVDAEGLIDQYAFDGRVALPVVVASNLNRWAVRCNVALWLPLSR